MNQESKDEKSLTKNGDIITIEEGEDLISIAQRRVDTVQKLINVSLKITTYRDWVNQNGTPYLVHSGAEKIARLFGIKLENINTERTWAEDSRGKYYIYKTTGRATLPGKYDSIEALGTCSQRDKFFAFSNRKWKDTLEIDETNIMKASYSNFTVNAITHLLGIRNLTWEQLEEAKIDTSKIQKVEYDKGKEKVGKTATEADKKKQKEIWDWLMQITGGNDEMAKERLKMESGFKSKDGNWIEGKTDPKYLTEKWLNITHKKIKKIFDAQLSQQELPEEEEK